MKCCIFTSKCTKTRLVAMQTQPRPAGRAYSALLSKPSRRRVEKRRGQEREGEGRGRGKEERGGPLVSKVR